jgi:hypothetical protein
MQPIFSSEGLRNIAKAVKQGKSETESTLDLGLTKTMLKLGKSGFFLGETEIKLPKLRDDDKSCYVAVNGELQKVVYFSEETKGIYRLVPTSEKPILQISGTSMHKMEFVERIKRDKLKGKVLDAGSGLGYTAIAAAETADEVVTVEFDSAVLEMQKLNPYSQKLFTSKNIKQVNADIVAEIAKFNDNEFGFIIFDAGTPRSSGEFFSLANYRQAFRVLKKGGKLYHYLPMHHVSRGRDFGAEVIARLKQAGFSKIERNIKDSYAIAVK